MTNRIFPFPRGTRLRPSDVAGKHVQDATKWCEPTSAESAVDKIMGAHRMRSQASVIWTAWPNLRSAAVKLAAHVGGYPGLKAPIVEEVLVAAVHVYAKHAEAGDSNQAAAEFLWALLGASELMLAKQLVAIDGNGDVHAWDYFGCSVQEWLAQLGARQFYLEDVPFLSAVEKTGGRHYLAHKIMGHREFGLMQERLASRKSA
jgi:hypothetical protein